MRLTNSTELQTPSCCIMKNNISGCQASRNQQANGPGAASETYLDIVGQLSADQVLELIFAQGAGRAVLAGVGLELTDDGADGSFHDALCWEPKSKWVEKQQSDREACWEPVAVILPVVWSDADWCKSLVPPLWLHLSKYIHASSPVTGAHISGKHLTGPPLPHPASCPHLCLISTTLGIHITDLYTHTATQTHEHTKKKKLLFCPTKGKFVLMVAQNPF